MQVCGGGSRWWWEGAGVWWGGPGGGGRVQVYGGECRWCVCCVESCMAHAHECDVQWLWGIYRGITVCLCVVQLPLYIYSYIINASP